MQSTLRAAFATAILASAVSAAVDRAGAIPLAAPTVSDAAATNADRIVRVRSVCGVGGCAPVFTKRVQHPPAGFVQRAVPLAVPKTITPQRPNQSK